MMFSVIIPAHNAEATLKAAIDSVNHQSFKDYELIVVCDSCTDKTEDVANHSNAEVIVGNYGSPGHARNAGLDMAIGEYVVFIDSDDKLYTSDALKIIAEKISEHPEIDILHYGFIYGEVYAPVYGNGGNMWCNVWSRAWKRSVIGDTRFNDKKIAEDFDFCNEVFPKAGTHAKIEMPLIWYTPPREGCLTWEAEHGNDNILSGDGR